MVLPRLSPTGAEVSLVTDALTPNGATVNDGVTGEVAALANQTIDDNGDTLAFFSGTLNATASAALTALVELTTDDGSGAVVRYSTTVTMPTAAAVNSAALPSVPVLIPPGELNLAVRITPTGGNAATTGGVFTLTSLKF